MYRPRPFSCLLCISCRCIRIRRTTRFPSSLTAFVAVAAVVIEVLAWGRRMVLVFVVGVAVVGFGCVYVGVHYATDVIAGAAIGAACGAITWWLITVTTAGQRGGCVASLERRLLAGAAVSKRGAKGRPGVLEQRVDQGLDLTQRRWCGRRDDRHDGRPLGPRPAPALSVPPLSACDELTEPHRRAPDTWLERHRELVAELRNVRSKGCR